MKVVLVAPDNPPPTTPQTTARPQRGRCSLPITKMSSKLLSYFTAALCTSPSLLARVQPAQLTGLAVVSQ